MDTTKESALKKEMEKAGIPMAIKTFAHISVDVENAGYKAVIEYLTENVEELHVIYEALKKKYINEVRGLKKASKKTAKEQYGRGVVDAQRKAQKTISNARRENRELTEEVLFIKSAYEALRESFKMEKDNYAIKLENHAEALRNIKAVLGSLNGKSRKEDILRVMKKVLKRC